MSLRIAHEETNKFYFLSVDVLISGESLDKLSNLSPRGEGEAKKEVQAL